MVIGAALIFYVLYTMYKAFKLGTSIVTAPFDFAKALWNNVSPAASSAASAVASDVSAAASIPSAIATSQALDTQLQTTVESDFAPGGRIYEQIVATQGQAAADANWAKVQADYANQASQSSWLSVVGL